MRTMIAWPYTKPHALETKLKVTYLSTATAKLAYFCVVSHTKKLTVLAVLTRMRLYLHRKRMCAYKRAVPNKEQRLKLEYMQAYSAISKPRLTLWKGSGHISHGLQACFIQEETLTLNQL